MTAAMVTTMMAMVRLIVMPLSIARIAAIAVVAIMLVKAAVAWRIVVLTIARIANIAISAVIIRSAIMRAMRGNVDQCADNMRCAAMRIAIVRLVILLGAGWGAGKNRERGNCGKKQGLHWKPPLGTRNEIVAVRKE